jgi:hypothetical protein
MLIEILQSFISNATKWALEKTDVLIGRKEKTVTFAEFLKKSA